MSGRLTPKLTAVPRHVAIIMDGNGRWAKKKHLPRAMGHKAGAKTVKKIVTAAREIGISVLTLYAFSTENWKRPALEVQALMGLLKTFLKSELPSMLENNIVLHCVGERARFPQDVQVLLDHTISETARHAENKDNMTLNLALNYGSRAEIVRAARKMAEKCKNGEYKAEEFSEELFAEHLYTAGQPDPDLIIRTGGEFRLSNFLLWQASYAEIYVTNTMWPDFNKNHFLKAIENFQNRERRYGKTGDQVREE